MIKDERNPFNIKIADIVFQIQPLNDYIREYCKKYVTDEKAEFIVKTEFIDIAFERNRSMEKTEFSDAYLETLAVYRKISEQLPMRNTILFHGSVIAVDNVGYLFTAKSGTGKSTHTRLWREYFGNRAVMVNDDKPLLKIKENAIFAYGTPWDGKHRLSTNVSVPLKAICVLTRDTYNHIEEIEPREAYQMLLQQTYRPMDESSMIQTLKILDELMKKVKFYRLGCNMESEAAKIAYEGMNTNKGEQS